METDLSLSEEIMREKATAYHATFEFKGVELHPFSEGRRAVASSIGVRLAPKPDDDGDDNAEKKDAPKSAHLSISVLDIHAIIFLCTQERRILAKAHRDPDAFWELILDWAEKNVEPKDYEEETCVAMELVKAAFATAAEDRPDMTGAAQLGDRPGN